MDWRISSNRWFMGDARTGQVISFIVENLGRRGCMTLGRAIVLVAAEPFCSRQVDAPSAWERRSKVICLLLGARHASSYDVAQMLKEKHMTSPHLAFVRLNHWDFLKRITTQCYIYINMRIYIYIYVKAQCLSFNYVFCLAFRDSNPHSTSSRAGQDGLPA